MSIVCPVKSHPDWKSLVNKVGEDEAYFLWNNYEGKVPIEVANNRRKSITELRKEIGIPHQINESNRPNILKKISNYNTKNQTSHSVNFDRVGQSQRLKVNLIVDFTPYSQQSREERAEMRSEEGKVFTESVQSIKEPVKEGVDFVFESNPELANEVYEALGFKTKADVILPIGTSGSGKSTFIKTLPQENLVVIEPDAMRVEFTGDMNNKSKDKEIYIEAAKRAVSAIKAGKQVVFDTTNLTKDKRLPFIEAIKKEIPTANIQYKLMELNPELAKQRIKAQLERGENRANVPDSTIDRHAESYKQMLEDIKNEPISNYEVTPQQKQQAQQLYSEYLDTIFPDSKVKDIVYHISNKLLVPNKGQVNFYIDPSTRDTKNYKFHILKNIENIIINIDTDTKNSNLNPTENYIFDNFNYELFTREWYNNPLDFYNRIINKAKEDTRTDVIEYLKGKETNVILNIQNPYNENIKSLNKTTVNEIKNKNNIDGIIGQESWGFGLDKTEKEIVVFEPEQIHILGSKQDIEGFKEFVRKSLPLEQQEQLKQKESNLQEYNKVKKAETMEEVKAQMLKDFDSYYPQFKDLLSWEKEMFIDMMSEGEINTYC